MWIITVLEMIALPVCIVMLWFSATRGFQALNLKRINRDHMFKMKPPIYYFAGTLISVLIIIIIFLAHAE